MSFLPEQASFQERVSDYFLAVRGGGLMLSPLDAQLLGEWSTLTVPFEVVARGIDRAAQRASFDARPGTPPLRSLRACRREVEAEIAQHLRKTVGRPSEAPVADATDLRSHLFALRKRPFAQRVAVVRRARKLAEQTGFSSPESRRQLRRFHQARLLCEEQSSSPNR